ncbi:hypothetical protein NX773_00630 [Massilia solisilvae]|uniref:Pilus assembly protein n=1 Tax=Massilia solisilvae TaxID=1811225 RepID=A0ABT2BDR0_9BURK|nr:hypothetical protein [Massilia solisilvae]MCS0606669.1 hypothetical protein [Massilia solisilvae]
MSLPPKAVARCNGQALTEFLVVALALVPLFLLMPLIAKYQDIAHQTQMASRYVAFDAAVRNEWQNSWKDPAQLAAEVRRRFFSNPDAPIKTNDTAGNFDAHRNLFWRGPTNEPLIADFDADVAISFGDSASPSQANGFTASTDGDPFNKTAGTGVETKIAEQLSLKAAGIFTGNVSVKLAKTPAFLKSYQPFDTIDLSITRHTSVVVNGWDADTPAKVVSRIDSKLLVPGTQLRKIASIADGFITPFEAGKVQPPQLGQLSFWQDVVPSDRLK